MDQIIIHTSISTDNWFIVLQSGIQQWNHIIEHIAAIDQFLDQQCLSFSATWSKLYNPSNGKVSWFVAVEAATGSLLIDCILRKLSNMNIPITDLLGQGYDNGSNMKGKISGVQQLVRNWHPRACYIPRCSHSLKLIVNDAVMPLEKCHFVWDSPEIVFFSASILCRRNLRQHI